MVITKEFRKWQIGISPKMLQKTNKQTKTFSSDLSLEKILQCILTKLTMYINEFKD